MPFLMPQQQCQRTEGTVTIDYRHHYHHFNSLASGYTSQHILSWSPSPEIGRVAAGRASSLKNIWDCIARLTFVLISVAAAGQLLYSEKREWDGISDLPRALSNPDLGEYKGNVGSCPRIFMFLSGCFPVLPSIRH